MEIGRIRLVTFLGAALAAIVALALLYGNNGRKVHDAAAPPAVLDKLKPVADLPPAPAATFVDKAGNEVKLADFRGRYLLVNLWATWCGPCIAELPALARLSAALPPDRFVVVPVDVLERLDADKVAEFLAMHDAGALPVYLDRAYSVQRGFTANELPLTVLIDDRGRILARAAGAQEWDHPDAVTYLKALSVPGGSAQ